MFIGHLPAGYLLARGLRATGVSRALAVGVLFGSIAPDVDMLWWAFVDSSVHHHTFTTHRPAVWVAVLVVGLLTRSHGLLGAGIGGVLHMALDSIAGAIAWGWPVWTDGAPLVVVPATQDHWVLSFLVHWTFRVEIAIVCVAALVLLLGWRRGRLL